MKTVLVGVLVVMFVRRSRTRWPRWNGTEQFAARAAKWGTWPAVNIG
jgi:hypothetical protein